MPIGSLGRLGAVLLLAWCGSAAAAAAPDIVVDVRSRALVPGEPVRFVVRATAPLMELSGAFLGQELFFVRTAAAGPGEEWSAWASIPLDQKAGRKGAVIKARAAGDVTVSLEKALQIHRKKFPEERLKVEPKYVQPDPAVEERIAREQQQLKAIYATRRAVPPSPTPFVTPVPGEASGIFGARRIFNGKPRAPHAGVDLRAGTGTQVKAAGPGRVAYSGDLYFSGETVILDHGGGLFTIYAHLSERHVAEGHAVVAGDLLGLSGATGRVTGPHLHWGARVGDRIFDPRALLDPRLY